MSEWLLLHTASALYTSTVNTTWTEFCALLELHSALDDNGPLPSGPSQ
jgi:hypothetical protein